MAAATEFGGALAHRGDPDAGRPGPGGGAVVADVQHELTGRHRQAYAAVLPVAVAYHVGDRLYGGAVGGDLDGGRQVRKVASVDGEPQMGAGGEPVGLRAQGTDEPEVVQRGRAQAVDDLAQVRQGLAGG